MPVCQNCDQKWSWKQTFKQSFTLDIGMNCPYCGQKQYVTKSSRIKSNLFNIIPIVTLPIAIWLEFSLGIALIFAFVIGLIIISLYPYTIELSNKEENFW